MNTIVKKFASFIKEEDGLTTVEYAVAGTLVALAVVGAFTQLGTTVSSSINRIENIID
jgi:pilus assembly protein Flp/PilA